MQTRRQKLEQQIRKLREELWTIERADSDKANTPLVGKAFKYRNSYGSGEWWLFALVTEASKGSLKGWRFEKAGDGQITTRFDDFLSCFPGDNWHEIPRTEFIAAWSELLCELETESNSKLAV